MWTSNTKIFLNAATSRFSDRSMCKITMGMDMYKIGTQKHDLIM